MTKSSLPGWLHLRAAGVLAASLFGMAFTGSALHAQNLLQNGSFESSTFTSSSAQSAGQGYVSPAPNYTNTQTATVPNWTWTADSAAGTNHNAYSSTFSLSRAGASETPTVPDGTLAVVFGAGSYSSGGSITQNFTPTAGSLYLASLSVGRIGGGETIAASVTIKNNVDGTTVATVPIDMSAVGSDLWKQVTFTFTAPSSNLSFTFTDTTAYGAADSTDLGLDNVSIQAASTQTLTILGGYGTAGNYADNTEYSVDNGATWHPAYLAGQHPWGNIPGTNQWINQAPNLTTGLYQTTLFRIKFTAPSVMASPDMKFIINADNIGAMSINGHTLQTTYGGYAPYPVYDLGAQYIVPGVNTLTLALTDQGGLVGMNYRIDLTAIAAQAITVVQLPPAIIVPATLSGTVGTAFSYQVNASNSPTSYSQSGLPANLSLNNISGFISGTPTVAGSFSIGLAASNAAGTGSASTTLNIARGSASFAFSNLVQTYTGSSLAPTVATTPGGLAYSLSYNGSTVAPVNAGSYPFVAVINDPNYSGTATNTLTINPATATITLGDLTQSYDGTPKSVSITTAPAGVATAVTYAGSPTAPTSVGSYPVAVTVADSNYTGSATGTLQIKDTTPPVLSLPANLTVEATSPVGAVATFAATANDNVDGAVAVTLTPASGSVFAVGTTTVTATATDAAGNLATGSFTVTVQDTTPPVIAAPANIVTEATGPNGAVATFTASATDLVDGSVAVTSSIASGSTFPLGTTAVTLTATDAHGNSATAVFSVTVNDTTAPVIAPEDNLIVEATGPTGAVVTFTPSALDIVSGAVAVAASPASGSTFALGTTTVTLAASDAAGNTATSTFTVTVRDTTPPVIASPGNLTAEATSAAGAVVTFSASASDLVDGAVAVTASPASGSTFALGMTTVTLTATDAHGNTASKTFTVTVKDTTPPALTVPASQTLEATGPAGALASFVATATDAVTASPTIGYSAASGSVFPLGTTTVVVTATDAAGNASTGSFTVTVRDTTPPVIAVPASQTLEATSAAGAVATFAASASDIVSGAVAVNSSAASGSTFPLGTTTVLLTATDAAGNTGAGSFTVTVVDTTPPVLTLPANQTLEATSAAGAVATYAASATDAVTASPAIAYSLAPGSTFALGTTAVTVTATDAAGNATTGSFTVTVRDTTAPVISSLTANPATLWPPNHKMVNVTVTAVVADLVDPAPVTKIVSVTSNETVKPKGDDDDDDDHKGPDWLITGNLTLQLRAERFGHGTGRIYTITVQSTDAAGNVSTKTVTVTVPKDQADKDDHKGDKDDHKDDGKGGKDDGKKDSDHGKGK